MARPEDMFEKGSNAIVLGILVCCRRLYLFCTRHVESQTICHGRVRDEYVRLCLQSPVCHSVIHIDWSLFLRVPSSSVLSVLSKFAQRMCTSVDVSSTEGLYWYISLLSICICPPLFLVEICRRDGSYIQSQDLHNPSSRRVHEVLM